MSRSAAAQVCVLILLVTSLATGHDHTAHKAQARRQAALRLAARLAEDPADASGDRPLCALTVDLLDGRNSLPGLVRVTNLDSGKAVQLPGEIHRSENWYALKPKSTVKVPPTRLRIEAFHGIQTERASRDIDLTGKAKDAVAIPLTSFYRPRAEGLRSGNTHLHLMRLTHAEAIRYLEVVPRADGLDLVYLSHLRRLPDERHYISNQIVENSLVGGELQRLSGNDLLFATGEEHRHNFGRGGEGYGHVMLLDIVQLIRPVSIGPGIMGGDETDGTPLQRGIHRARDDGATVVWCHNTFGFEDVPNWMAGVLDAQNIFDGGTHGSYRDTFYKYLNLGLKVPFSTGTDWFIYDFSRVYVPLEGELTSKKWLTQLAAGRSYITNGTFLELTVNQRPIGDTIELSGPGRLKIRATGVGRNNFGGLELILNGKVVHTDAAQASDEHFEVSFDHELQVESSGWVALRIPLEAEQNELGQNLFAHTSPVYVDVAGTRRFDPQLARELIEEIQGNIGAIQDKGRFASDERRERVLDVHRRGIETLQEKIERK